MIKTGLKQAVLKRGTGFGNTQRSLEVIGNRSLGEAKPGE
jgi:hypothetical protein